MSVAPKPAEADKRGPGFIINKLGPRFPATPSASQGELAKWPGVALAKTGRGDAWILRPPPEPAPAPGFTCGTADVLAHVSRRSFCGGGQAGAGMMLFKPRHYPLFAFLAFLVLAPPLGAEEPAPSGPRPAVTPLIAPKTGGKDESKAAHAARDRATIARVETYLNELRSLRADFTQTLPDGRITRGKLVLKRPGRMRLEYAPPHRDLLVADGLFIHAWDSRAKTSSSVPLGQSLADIILRDPFTFSGDITVTAVHYYPSMLEIDVTQAGNPDAGMMTLEFEDNPLVLRNWRVTDAQGLTTRVALSNAQANVEVPSSTFLFDPPRKGRF